MHKTNKNLRNKEDRAGEVFFKLMTDDFFRKGIISLLAKKTNTPFSPDLAFRPKVRLGESGIPDIIGYNKTSEIEIIIELKINAELTEKQPEGYLGELNLNKLLLFICPKKRVQKLFEDLSVRCQDSKFGEINKLNHSSHEFCLGSIDGRFIACIGWQYLIDYLDRQLQASKLSAELYQLKHITEKDKTPLKFPLDEFSLEKKSARLLGRLGQAHKRSSCKTLSKKSIL
jgi:hypothetical protein